MKDFYMQMPEYAKVAVVAFLSAFFTYFGVPFVADNMPDAPPAVVESE